MLPVKYYQGKLKSLRPKPYPPHEALLKMTWEEEADPGSRDCKRQRGERNEGAEQSGKLTYLVDTNLRQKLHHECHVTHLSAQSGSNHVHSQPVLGGCDRFPIQDYDKQWWKHPHW